MVEAIPVISSSSALSLSIFTFAFVIPASAVPSSNATAVATFVVAPVAASFDAAAATAPAVVNLISFLSALQTSVLVVQTFSSSFLARSASTPWSNNTSASTVVPGVALQHLCRCLARRDAEYANLENLYAVEEACIKNLMAEMQILNEQVILGHDR